MLRKTIRLRSYILNRLFILVILFSLSNFRPTANQITKNIDIPYTPLFSNKVTSISCVDVNLFKEICRFLVQCHNLQSAIGKIDQLLRGRSSGWRVPYPAKLCLAKVTNFLIGDENFAQRKFRPTNFRPTI